MSESECDSSTHDTFICIVQGDEEDTIKQTSTKPDMMDQNHCVMHSCREISWSSRKINTSISGDHGNWLGLHASAYQEIENWFKLMIIFKISLAELFFCQPNWYWLKHHICHSQLRSGWKNIEFGRNCLSEQSYFILIWILNFSNCTPPARVL